MKGQFCKHLTRDRAFDIDRIGVRHDTLYLPDYPIKACAVSSEQSKGAAKTGQTVGIRNLKNVSQFEQRQWSSWTTDVLQYPDLPSFS